MKMPPDPSSDEPLFHVSHIDRVYTLKTETLNERHVCKNLAFCVTTRPCFCVKHSHIFTASIRAAWVQKIKAASEHFIETEKKKREKAYQGKHSYTLILSVLTLSLCRASWYSYHLLRCSLVNFPCSAGLS